MCYCVTDVDPTTMDLVKKTFSDLRKAGVPFGKFFVNPKYGDGFMMNLVRWPSGLSVFDYDGVNEISTWY